MVVVIDDLYSIAQEFLCLSQSRSSIAISTYLPLTLDHSDARAGQQHSRTRGKKLG